MPARWNLYAVDEELTLQRLFSTFPEGIPGLGLLILRLTVAGTILVLSLFFFSDLIKSTFRGWLIGAISIVISATMILGFLTPVVSALISIAAILFLTFSPREVYFPVEVYLIILSSVLILLGPGAYSLDARLFGRREIILPKKK